MRRYLIFFMIIGFMMGTGCTSSQVGDKDDVRIEESAEREARPDYFELQYRDRHRDRQRHHWN